MDTITPSDLATMAKLLKANNSPEAKRLRAKIARVRREIAIRTVRTIPIGNRTFFELVE